MEEKNFKEEEEVDIFRIVSSLIIQKWYIPIKLVINREHPIKTISLFDTSVELNCI